MQSKVWGKCKTNGAVKPNLIKNYCKQLKNFIEINIICDELVTIKFYCIASLV